MAAGEDNFFKPNCDFTEQSDPIQQTRPPPDLLPPPVPLPEASSYHYTSFHDQQQHHYYHYAPRGGGPRGPSMSGYGYHQQQYRHPTKRHPRYTSNPRASKRGRRHHQDNDDEVDIYYHPSMTQDPWKHLLSEDEDRRFNEKIAQRFMSVKPDQTTTNVTDKSDNKESLSSDIATVTLLASNNSSDDKLVTTHDK